MNYAMLNRKNDMWYEYAARIRMGWTERRYFFNKHFLLFTSIETWGLSIQLRQGLYSEFQGADITL